MNNNNKPSAASGRNQSSQLSAISSQQGEFDPPNTDKLPAPQCRLNRFPYNNLTPPPLDNFVTNLTIFEVSSTVFYGKHVV